MNISVEGYQKRIITPVWSSSVRENHKGTPINLFPARMNNHSRRFYGRSSSRKSQVTPTSFHLSSSTTRIDNGVHRSSVQSHPQKSPKNRSHTIMAFCSTSKVKRAPLAGQSPADPFAGLRLGTNHPTIYTPSPRPISRPIVIHGKRFTVVPVINQSNNGLSYNSEETNNAMQKTECSDQRQRFVEAEKQHFYSKVYRRGNTENQETSLPKNYCISGLGLNWTRPHGIKEFDISARRDNRKSHNKINGGGEQNRSNGSNTKTPRLPLVGSVTQHSQTEQFEGALEVEANVKSEKLTDSTTSAAADKLIDTIDPDTIVLTMQDKDGKESDNSLETENGVNATSGSDINIKLVDRLLQSYKNETLTENDLELHTQTVSDLVFEFYRVILDEIGDSETQLEQSSGEIWRLLTPQADSTEVVQQVDQGELDSLLANINALMTSHQDPHMPLNIADLMANIDQMTTFNEKEIRLMRMLFNSLNCSNVNKADINNLMECIKLFANKSSTTQMLMGILFCLNILKHVVSVHKQNIGHESNNNNNKEDELKVVLMMVLNRELSQIHSSEQIYHRFQSLSNENSSCSSQLLHCLTMIMKLRMDLAPTFISIDDFVFLESRGADWLSPS